MLLLELGLDSRASNPGRLSVNGNTNYSSLLLSCNQQRSNRVGIDNNFKPNAWLHPCQKQAYEDIGQAVIMIQQPNKNRSEGDLNMYFDRMQFAGAPDKPSFNWDKRRIDFVSNEVWGRGEILPIGFYKTDGRNIFEIRSSSGGVTTADIFYMVCGTQFFVNNPAATAYIDNLLIPEGYQ
jgi:hypothetical protein